MKKLLISILVVWANLVFALSASASSGWIVYHESAFKGRVIDAETKEPIEGAVVVAIYYIRRYGIGAGIESNALPADAKEVLTDKNGEFYIASHTFVHFWPFAGGEITEFIIYKPGHTSFPSYDYYKYIPQSPFLDMDLNKRAEEFRKGIVVELMRLNTKEGRLKAIPGTPPGVRSKQLPLLYKAINEENKRFGLGRIK